MSTQTLPTSTHVSQANFAITTPTKRTSRVLAGFGIAEIVFSIFLFSSCIWSSSIDNTIVSAYLGFACAIFHAVLGVLAILAGRNLDQHRGCLIACLVMGIVGSGIFALATLISDSVQWANYRSGCWYCRDNYENNSSVGWTVSGISGCFHRCIFPTPSLFFPILFFTIIEAFIGIVLSGIACCKLSSCCNRTTPGAIYRQGNVHAPAYQPQSYPQQLIVDQPPNYSQCTGSSTSTQSAIPSVHQTNYAKI